MKNPWLGGSSRRGYRGEFRKTCSSENRVHVPRMPLFSARRRISSIDPFGNTLSKSGPLAEGNTYRFSSQDYHQISGLLLYLRRAYDPNLQRWLSRDPIEEGGGFNLYAYVENDAVNRLDAFGLRTEVLLFDPVGHGTSSEGHSAISINGTTYSFGPGGWATLPDAEFLAANTKFRSGTGLVLNLDDIEEQHLLQWIATSKQSKPPFEPTRQNCTTMIRNALNDATHLGDFPVIVTPWQLKAELMARELALTGEINFYAATGAPTKNFKDYVMDAIVWVFKHIPTP